MKNKAFLPWFIAGIILWCAATGYYYLEQNRLKPMAMVHTIEQDLQSRQREATAILNNKELWHHVFNNQLSEREFNLLLQQKFIIYAYNKNELQFWNTNTTPITTIRRTDTPYTLILDKSVYLAKRVQMQDSPSRHVDILIPIFRFYSVSNEYLHSYFAASPDIPANSTISTVALPGSFRIRSQEGHAVGYIQIPAADIKPLCPDTTLLLLCLLALLCSVMAVHLLAFSISHRSRPLYGASFLWLTVIAGRIVTYRFGFPFHIGDLELFSPQIFASSKFLPSFGDLMLNILAVYWALYFTLSQYERQPFRPLYHLPALLRWSLFVVFCMAISAFCLYLLSLIQVLVLDSVISFDTNSFDATDLFTLLVLVTITVISRLFFISIRFFSLNINQFIPNTWVKYMAYVLLSLISVFLLRPLIFSTRNWPASIGETLLYLVAFQLGILYIYLRSTPRSNAVFGRHGLFTLIFWSVYCSIICAVFFKFYITQQERHIARIAFAEKLSRQQDAEMELQFPALSDKISNDTTIQNWVERKDSLALQDIQKHFSLMFLEPSLVRYAGHFFVYRADKQPIIAANIPAFDTLDRYIRESIPTMNEGLFFRNQLNDNGYYLVKIPIKGRNKEEPIAYLFAELKLKKNISQSLYPRLLQNRNETNIRKKRNYSYAIYSKGELKSQSGDYNFLLHIGNLPGNLPYWYYERNDLSELYYRGDNGVVYVIACKDAFGVGVLTIFSFLFGIYLIISLIENWFIQIISFLITGRKIRLVYNWSLSMRIKYFALSFTIISFFVIGISTVIFLTDRYKSSSSKQIEQSMSNISDVLSEYFQNRNMNITAEDLHEKINNQDFIYSLSNIALQQKLDINIYDVKGHLVLSTQEGIYNEKVLSRIMLPEALFQLSQKQLYRLIETEQIGTLVFTSIYTPIVNHDDQIIGYLNIPSFYSQQALGSQITSLLTTLVNIYTILLLLSSIITFLFINSLSKSLRLVANSLKNVNLKKNELIYWPYKDEIGLLVSEYNKMVIAVEKNAMSLVKDERQSAWREMAKQVAHEIKNPLTPMKLNMQYLQQAINNNHPDIIGLAKKVAGSIIEQIDNLNYIASEFSNFAKMPEKNTEKIDLISMMSRIVDLYQNETNLDVTYSFPEQDVFIFSDKSQMLRIFTNIIQNAADAIPDDRRGLIHISLIADDTAEKVTIRISDNGSGIEEDIKARIFEPYFTTKTSGTGLGLAMTKKIIELWGGEIWFESTQDEGTTFYIRLPFGH